MPVCSLGWSNIAIALNLLKQGFPMDATAQATGLTLAQLQQLQGEPERE